ncbi:protein phosphatase 1L-like [Patiria miniata]|uniref:Protein phosphatase 1L n=1 Tax=Patiria miniata TaxID=46514 RepID=A0A913ZFM9_PATMI|nr:protein phosphatase 1L-like [Patiria miniata]
MTLLAVVSRLIRNTVFKYETVAFVIALLFLYSFVFHRDSLRSVFNRARVSVQNSRLNALPNGRVSGQVAAAGSLSSDRNGKNSGPKQWELRKDNVAVYSIQGRRPRMEDRYDFVHDKNHSGVAMYGIFDGHGGAFAADFTEKLLSQSVMARVLQALLKEGKANHSQILIEEILSLDEKFLTVARSNNDVAGTTALVALLSGNELTVANVGDSRGVMCDHEGRTVPLSFDHKPHLPQERKRIKKAGGFITFNGVWRVAGILATSRAIGDYPLKDRKFVVADPDIQTFDLSECKPQFLILASDGLWDAFSNEEAVMYVKERLDEPHFGAKSIVLQAYYRGSLDNITVMVLNFKAGAAAGNANEKQKDEGEI